jgi:two-component system response regulator
LLALDALRTTGTPCEIVVTRDGVEALDYLFAHGAYAGRDRRVQPSVVLLDLKLPKLSGFDVLNRIRADQLTRLVPVVLLTSSSQEEDMIRGYLEGANSFVRKPIQFDHFLGAMRTLGQYWLAVNEIPRAAGSS